MNVQAQVRQNSNPQQLKLTVDQFWHLKKAGAFSAYGKSELLSGEPSGVPLRNEDEPESDASIAIKLRIQDYLLLDQAGLLDGHSKIELLDGVLYEMSPQHRPHFYAKNELTYRLRRALEESGSSLYVGSEGSVLISEFNLPEPDVIVTSEPLGTGPIPVASLHLLVEIADTTGAYDLGLKAHIYATAGVPEYWVHDLSRRKLHQFWTPTAGLYAQNHIWAFGERLKAATLPLAIDIPK